MDVQTSFDILSALFLFRKIKIEDYQYNFS